MCGQIIGPYHAIAYEEPRNSLVSESFPKPLSPGFQHCMQKSMEHWIFGNVSGDDATYVEHDWM